MVKEVKYMVTKEDLTLEEGEHTMQYTVNT